MSAWGGATEERRHAGQSDGGMPSRLRSKVMEKVQVRLAAERDDWMDLLHSEGLADKVKRARDQAVPERDTQPVPGTDSPYTQATAARINEAYEPPRSPAASPPRRQPKSRRDPNDGSGRVPTPPVSPAGPPPSPPKATDGARRGRPNRRMAAQSSEAAHRDDSGSRSRDWRDITHDRSPSIGSHDDRDDQESEDDRRLERARKRGRAAWEQARTIERQRESIRKLKKSLDVESQLRAKAEGVSDEAVVELEKLRAALADERATRERAEELLAVAADAGHKAVAEVAQCNESISDAEKREQLLQDELDKLREWQAAAAEGTTAAADKLLELQQELFTQEAELQQTKLELETVKQQCKVEVGQMAAQLERTQQQLDAAKAALAQSKREGEAKDQAMHDGQSTLSELANRLSTQLTTANAEAEAARLAEAQVSAQLLLEEQHAQATQSKLETAVVNQRAGQELADAAAWTAANSYGETLVPRQWLSSVSEVLEERTSTYQDELAVMTNMVDVSTSLQAELQQRQTIMEETVTAKLRMVAMGHAASRIQFAYLRYRLRSHQVDAAELRRQGTSLSMAVQLAEQERDIERQTLSQTLGQAQAKAKQAEQAREATLEELQTLRTTSAEVLSQEVKEMSHKQEIEQAKLKLAAEQSAHEHELRAHNLELALGATSARLQRERSASKIQHSYRQHRGAVTDRDVNEWRAAVTQAAADVGAQYNEYRAETSEQMARLYQKSEAELESQVSQRQDVLAELATREAQINNLKTELQQAKEDLVAATAQLELQHSPSQHSRLVAAQEVAEAATARAQLELSKHEEQAAELRDTIDGTTTTLPTHVQQPLVTDSSDSDSDASGIISYTTGLGSLNREYVHPPSPNRTSIVVTGRHVSDAEPRKVDSDSTGGASIGTLDALPDELSNPKPRTTTEDFIASRSSLASLLGPQEADTCSPLKANELAAELSDAVRVSESDALRRRLHSAEGDLKTMNTEFKTLLSEIARECEMVTFYTWLGPEPRLSSHYSFHQGSWRAVWSELRKAILQLRDKNIRVGEERNLMQELELLKERVAEAELEAENARLAVTSKEIHLRLKEEELDAYAQELEGRAKGWQQDHAAAVNALENRATQLAQEHETALAVLRSELEESRLEQETVQFELAHGGHSSDATMQLQTTMHQESESAPTAQTVPQHPLATEPDSQLPNVHPKQQAAENRLRQLFEMVDADKSGSISRVELSDKLRLDEEMQALLAEIGRPSSFVLEQLDRNGDSAVTFDELLSTVLDAQELTQAEKSVSRQTTTTKVARMVIQNKKFVDWSFILSKTTPSVIGRSARKTDANCVLPGTAADKAISRKHAQIDYVASNDEFALTCLGANVVKVNDQVVDAHHKAVSLKDGDKLRFGSSEVIFDVKDESTEREPEPEPLSQSHSLAQATLTLREQLYTHWVFELPKSDVAIIGRETKPTGAASGADYCALPGTRENKSISRKHAQIEYSAVGDKYMLSSLGMNVVRLNNERLVDSKHGPVAIKDGDMLHIGSSTTTEPVVVQVNIPPPLERGSSVKELVRTFTPQGEDSVTHSASNVATSKEPIGKNQADPLLNAEKDLDAVLEGVETQFLRAEAERCIQRERKANSAKLEQMQARIRAADSRATAAIEETEVYAAKVSQLTQDLEHSTEIASTAIAEAGRLRAALQQKHGKEGQEVLRLNAELDAANKAVKSAESCNLELTAQLEKAMRDAAQIKEEHELEVSNLQVERDEARYQAELCAAEAHAWAEANPYRTEEPSSEPEGTVSSCQEQTDEATEVKLQQEILLASNTGNTVGGGVGLKPPVGTEDVGPAAYEKQLKSVMSQAEQLLAADAQQGGLQLGAQGLEVLDKCRKILRRAGEPRMGASLTTRRAELASALASSSKLAHWFDAERQSLQSRLDMLQDPTYLDARGRVLHDRTNAAVKLQSIVRGFLLRKTFFNQLELEARVLSYEVATEARLRWRRIAQAITDARPARYMLQQLYAKMAEEEKNATTGTPSALASSAVPANDGGIIVSTNPEKRMESLCNSAARALQALESQSELMFALCRRDYTKLKRRFDARAHGREQEIEAREQAASASKLQAMWRGRSVRSAHKTQREATSLLLEIQMLDQGEDIPSAERALPTPLGTAGEPQPTVATAKETPQKSEGSDAAGVGALLEEWLLPERELPRPT